MDIEKITQKEQHSKKYAANYFTEEWEMEGIFESDTKILEHFFTKKGKLLDVSMGPGRHVKLFAEKGFDVWGNDINKHMIAEAKKYVKYKATYTHHDMRNLTSIPANYFDYVICMGASLGGIYKGSERLKAVREMRRVAKRGGMIVVHGHNVFEMPDASYIRDFVTMIKNTVIHGKTYEFGDAVYDHSDVLGKAYMHWFTEGELRNLFKKTGINTLQIIRLSSPDQNRVIRGHSPLNVFKTGGFVIIGKK